MHLYRSSLARHVGNRCINPLKAIPVRREDAFFLGAMMRPRDPLNENILAFGAVRDSRHEHQALVLARGTILTARVAPYGNCHSDNNQNQSNHSYIRSPSYTLTHGFALLLGCCVSKLCIHSGVNPNAHTSMTQPHHPVKGHQRA